MLHVCFTWQVKTNTIFSERELINSAEKVLCYGLIVDSFTKQMSSTTLG